jgi:ribonuclease-3
MTAASKRHKPAGKPRLPHPPVALPPEQAALESRLNHRFARPELLQLALTHRSHTYEARHGIPKVILPARPDQREMRNQPGSDNEQLEFLGDAVLGLAVTEALFGEFQQCSEGELTRLRSNLVSRKRMAQMGEDLGLAQALLLGQSAEQNGGRSKPALLANAAEAVLAALYLDVRDSGGDGLQAVQSLALRYLVQPELEAMRSALANEAGRGAMRDHKTLLQERVQAQAAGKLRYMDTGQSGPPHQRRFSVEAQLENAEGLHVLAAAEGPSKKEAQQRAAELALAQWGANQPTPAPREEAQS